MGDVCESALDRSGCLRLSVHQIFVTFNGHPLEPTATLQQAGVARGSTLWLRANPAAVDYQMTPEDAVAALEGLPPHRGFGEGEHAAAQQKQVEAAAVAALTPLYRLEGDLAAPYRTRVASALRVSGRCVRLGVGGGLEWRRAGPGLAAAFVACCALCCALPRLSPGTTALSCLILCRHCCPMLARPPAAPWRRLRGAGSAVLSRLWIISTLPISGGWLACQASCLLPPPAWTRCSTACCPCWPTAHALLPCMAVVGAQPGWGRAANWRLASCSE